MKIDCVVGPKDGFSEKIAEQLNVDFIEMTHFIFKNKELKPTIKQVSQVNGKKSSFC